MGLFEKIFPFGQEEEECPTEAPEGPGTIGVKARTEPPT